MTTNWHLQRKAQTGGVWSQRDDTEVWFQNFSWNPRKSANTLNPQLPVLCLWQEDKALPASGHSWRWEGITRPRMETWEGDLCFQQHLLPSWYPAWASPVQCCALVLVVQLRHFCTKLVVIPGGINQVFKDAEDQEVSGRVSDTLKETGEWRSMENTNRGGNFIKFCWVPGGTEIAVTDCCYSHTKSAAKLGTEPSSLKSWSGSANTTTLPLGRLSITTPSWLWTGQSMSRGSFGCLW